jgi:predicted signal transduction protein with EAL and GGDEF domain
MVLRAVAERIAAVAHAASADVARWGGDEFVIIAPVRRSPSCNAPSSAVLLAGDIIQTLSRPVVIGAQKLRVGGTVGMATYPADGATPDALVSAADLAMYDGKQSGGSVVRVYDLALARAAARNSDLERDLRQALRDGSLSIAFQPIVELPEQRCSTMEALARWYHPARGTISPGEFIPLAEQTGLIGELGRWILERACQEAAGWPEADRPAVAVNVSLAQVLSGELVNDVTAALTRSGLPASQLHIELTESMVGAEHERVVPVLVGLRALGVSIALDDFGTGFSSLSRLRTWPVNIVKIDESFVRTMADDGGVVIRATLLVAREYGLAVIAEGVETVEQWKELTGLGVRSFQGHLFATPLAPEAVAPWLNHIGRLRSQQRKHLGWGKLANSAVLIADRELGEIRRVASSV